MAKTKTLRRGKLRPNDPRKRCWIPLGISVSSGKPGKKIIVICEGALLKLPVHPHSRAIKMAEYVMLRDGGIVPMRKFRPGKDRVITELT